MVQKYFCTYGRPGTVGVIGLTVVPRDLFFAARLLNIHLVQFIFCTCGKLGSPDMLGLIVLLYAPKQQNGPADRSAGPFCWGREGVKLSRHYPIFGRLFRCCRVWPSGKYLLWSAFCVRGCFEYRLGWLLSNHQGEGLRSRVSP